MFSSTPLSRADAARARNDVQTARELYLQALELDQQNEKGFYGLAWTKIQDKPGPDSPPTITQSISNRFRSFSGVSKGTQERNLMNKESGNIVYGSEKELLSVFRSIN
jgi:hypothetical protein